MKKRAFQPKVKCMSRVTRRLVLAFGMALNSFKNGGHVLLATCAAVDRIVPLPQRGSELLKICTSVGPETVRAITIG